MPLCVVWGADGEGKEKTPASTHGGLVAKFKVTTDPEGQWVQLSGKRYSIPLLRAHFGCEMCWAMTVTKKNGPLAFNVCAFKGQPGHGKLGRLHKIDPAKKREVMADLSRFEFPPALRGAPGAGSEASGVPSEVPNSGTPSQSTGGASQSTATGGAAAKGAGRGKGGAAAAGRGAGRGSASGN